MYGLFLRLFLLGPLMHAAHQQADLFAVHLACGIGKREAPVGDDSDVGRDFEDLVEILADDQHARTGLGEIDQETYAFRGRVAYEFSDAATLSYIGGYRHFDQTSFLTLPIQYRSVTFVDLADTQSHELRLNGEIGGVIYQIGGFYFKEELERENGFALPIGPRPGQVRVSSATRTTFTVDSWSRSGNHFLIHYNGGRAYGHKCRTAGRGRTSW